MPYHTNTIRVLEINPSADLSDTVRDNLMSWFQPSGANRLRYRYSQEDLALSHYTVHSWNDIIIITNPVKYLWQRVDESLHRCTITAHGPCKNNCINNAGQTSIFRPCSVLIIVTTPTVRNRLLGYSALCYVRVQSICQESTPVGCKRPQFNFYRLCGCCRGRLTRDLYIFTSLASNAYLCLWLVLCVCMFFDLRA